MKKNLILNDFFKKNLLFLQKIIEFVQFSFSKFAQKAPWL